MIYQEALQWIHTRERFGIKPGLERMEYLLKGLGNPHQGLKVIHIGGSNGKGSTAAFTASLLKAAGYKVGLYTSPYLKAFSNRMVVDGVEVGEETLISLVERIKPLVEAASGAEPGPPTEFEVVTAMAFLYFAKAGVDYLVLEVGLGGRLDATNVVENPLVSVITNISLEHTAVLGNTIKEIAREKAGIIKEGVPVVTSAQNSEALEVIEVAAGKKKAPLFIAGRDYFFKAGDAGLRGQYFSYQGRETNYQDLFIPLLGRHQLDNAAAALASLEAAGLKTKDKDIRQGFKDTSWPGRFEILKHDPPVVIDAAHNPAAARRLREALADYFPGKGIVLVLGILGDKAVKEFLTELIPAARLVILTRAMHPTRAQDPEETAVLARGLTSNPVIVVDSLREALLTAGNRTLPGEAVCISGSFYTISEARRLLTEEKII
ncbi:MAG TPA: bifunctional folylpolyglutamate synthase/dihydrofolate synthase [Firmicutes bacterium]|nr:bifunctional folylpolyglutamate synthase/dihydrofolate synthase [Bacillota bacterium]